MDHRRAARTARGSDRPARRRVGELSLLSALAMAIPHVELGTLVTCTGFRNPALLAKIAETVDTISGGRLILGLGSGDVAFEHHEYGFPFDHCGQPLRGGTAHHHPPLARRATATFRGSITRCNEAVLEPRGPRPQGPPILIGTLATGKRMLRLAAQYADIWNGWLGHGRSWPDVLPPLREAIDAACVQQGRDPATLQRTVVAASPLLGETVIGGVEPLTGTTREIADAFRAYARGGVSHIQVWLVPNDLRGIEAFAAVLEDLDRGESR